MSRKTRKALRVAVVGSTGRMGQEICNLISADQRFQLAAEINSEGWTKVQAEKIDVVIEFSSPKGVVAATKWCVKNRVCLVSGTTGLSRVQMGSLKSAGKKIPLLYSPNMSLGIAAMNSMLAHFQNLPTWDFHVEEVHHKLKRDKPSGTALLLDQRLADVTGKKLPAPNSVRGGGVPGIHQVWAMGEDEVILLQHWAFQRRVFARGALAAAAWLFDKKSPGLYDLQDLYAIPPRS